MADRNFIKAVNQKFSLPALLKAMGIVFHVVPTTLRCPFHDDSSKSAKLFEDDRLFCWTCHKSYGPYDALQAMGCSDNEIRRQLSTLGVVILDPDKRFEVDEEKALGLKAKFRLGKLPLNTLLDEVYRMAEESQEA